MMMIYYVILMLIFMFIIYTTTRFLDVVLENDAKLLVLLRSHFSNVPASKHETHREGENSEHKVELISSAKA